MAVSEKRNIRPWATSNKAPPTRVFQMTAGQGILMPNAPVKLTSGLIVLSSTDDTEMLGYITGVVDRSTTWPLTAALSANDEVRVVIARSGDIWAVYADNNDSDVAVTIANVGVRYAMRVSSLSGAVGYVTADVNDTSNDMFQVVNIASEVEPQKFGTGSPGVLLVQHVGTLQGD